MGFAVKLPPEFKKIENELLSFFKYVEKRLEEARSVKKFQSKDLNSPANIKEGELGVFKEPDGTIKLIIRFEGETHVVNLAGGGSPGGGGGGTSKYVDLTDTPSSLTANAIQVADATGSNLTQLAPGSDGNVIYVTSGAFASATKEQAGVMAIMVDTEANILAATPAVKTIGIPTDTASVPAGLDAKRFYFWDGAKWYRTDIPLYEDKSSPDIGYLQDSSRSGYHANYITDKTLHNCAIKGNSTKENGAIRIDVTKDPDTFEIYLRNKWQTLLYDLTYETGDFRHAPVAEDIKVWSGMSVNKASNNRPFVNEYKTSMGALPPPRRIDGGSF